MAEDQDPRATARRLLGHLDSSPTPYHAADRAAELLAAAGFVERDERAAWTAGDPTRWFVRR
ncbi:MAG TPA: hypothetical protein VID94_12775, partial [Acidimicrobiales bacterium]